MSTTFVAVSENTAEPDTPVVVAEAVKLPDATAAAVTEASPFDPVVAVEFENLSPVPVNVTTEPETGLPLASFTMTTSGFANAEPYGVVWPEPETAEVPPDELPIVSVYGLASLAA